MIVFVIPTIPPRAHLLKRARKSIASQTKRVDVTLAVTDADKQGASATRNRGVDKALDLEASGFEFPDWVGFLDDDDVLLPRHVELLTNAADERGVGVAWGWYKVIGGRDPLPAEFRGMAYNPDAPHCTPITYMVRGEVLRDVWAEGVRFNSELVNTGYWSQDEVVLTACVRKAGHVALPDTTWHWHHDSGNTSGSPQRW